MVRHSKTRGPKPGSVETVPETEPEEESAQIFPTPRFPVVMTQVAYEESIVIHQKNDSVAMPTATADSAVAVVQAITETD